MLRALGDSLFHGVYIRTAKQMSNSTDKVRISAVGAKSPLKNFEQPASSGVLPLIAFQPLTCSYPKNLVKISSEFLFTVYMCVIL